MTGFVYAAPELPVSAPQHPWESMKITWTDYSGTVWDLCGQQAVKLRAGVRGFNMPPIDPFTLETPALAGSRFRGWRVREREVFWPLTVFKHTSAAEWVEHDSKFWAGMHPDREGVWAVESPTGTRKMRLRFANDGDHAMDLMPTLFGFQQYNVYLTAYDPYWFGESISRAWAQSPGRDFYGGPDGKAPLFYISSGSQLSSATMTNPGDVDAWPIWEVTGPATSVTVGVGGRTVTAPFTIGEGSTLVIDTDPAKRSALLDGENVYGSLSSWDFAPIPAGVSLPLSLAMAGAGAVQATITPRFFRAW